MILLKHLHFSWNFTKGEWLFNPLPLSSVIDNVGVAHTLFSGTFAINTYKGVVPWENQGDKVTGGLRKILAASVSFRGMPRERALTERITPTSIRTASLLLTKAERLPFLPDIAAVVAKIPSIRRNLASKAIVVLAVGDIIEADHRKNIIGNMFPIFLVRMLLELFQQLFHIFFFVAGKNTITDTRVAKRARPRGFPESFSNLTMLPW